MHYSSTDISAETKEAVAGKSLVYDYGIMALPSAFSEGIEQPLPQRVPLDFGNNEIRWTPPGRFRNRQHGAVALDIESEVWGRYPKSQLVADAVKRDSWFSRQGFSVAVHLAERPDYVSLTLPGEWEALQHFFSQNGVTIRPSGADYYGSTLMQSIGGMQNAAALASPMALAVFDALAIRSSHKVAQRVLALLEERSGQSLSSALTASAVSRVIHCSCE
jgi:hypothetical protein